MSPAPAAYHFLPWVRNGLLTGPLAADAAGVTLPAHAALPLTLRLTSVDAAARSASQDATVNLALYGPGDVLGIDPREIVRTIPRPNAPDFPPHLLAGMEFDRPDFPWLFTPAAPSGQRLRPWIVLAVVRRALARLTVNPDLPLPVLECPVTELPDLVESALWAHAQYTGSLDGTPVQDVLGQQQQTVSRLLCPRRLEPSRGGPNDGYLACLLPAFDVGRKAGLGQAISASDEANLRPAWTLAAGGAVQVPVYYSWEFATGAAGDFEDLIRHLSFPSMPPVTTSTLMDMSHAGAGVDDAPGATLGVPSALRSIAAPPPQAWTGGPAGSYDTFQQQLRTRLTAQPGTVSGVQPPTYGRFQVAGAADAIDPLASAPGWLSTLNLDPRYRVAAALGTQVAQQQQEALVASAWQQADEIETANRFLRQKQLGREVTRSIYERRLKTLSTGALEQITAPVAAPPPAPSASAPLGPLASQASQPASPPATLPIQDAAASGAFRRLTRPQGPLLTRPLPTTNAPTPQVILAQLVTRVATSDVSTLQLAPKQTTTEIGVAATGVPLAGDGQTPSSTMLRAATATQTDPRTALLQSLDPGTTFLAEAQARLALAPELQGAWTRPEPLAPLTFTPTFPQPMYEALRDQARDRLLPGLDQIPNNSLVLLQVDSAFVEAFMVGLNNELSRELLWREFPADLRGTYFRQFWDVRDQLPPNPTESDREALRDIPPLSAWRAPLGSNLSPGRGNALLLLAIKGDLLERFPTALIFASPGRWSKDANYQNVGPPVVDDTQTPSLPSLRVDPVPGVTLLGFAIPGGRTAAVGSATPAAGGSPGWFFVLQEHPTEPRFGLDLSAGRLDTWRALSWADVTVRPDDSGYIAAAARTPTLWPLQPGAPPPAVARWNRESQLGWGRDGGQTGYITLQNAFRAEVHARFWFGS